MSAALKQAAQAILNRWENTRWEWSKQGPAADLMTDLRKALEAAPQQEPVGYVYAADLEVMKKHGGITSMLADDDGGCIPVYAAPQQAQAPGWRLVPVEPTPEMRKAAIREQEHHRRVSLSLYGDEPAAMIYRAMLAAAPQGDKT